MDISKKGTGYPKDVFEAILDVSNVSGKNLKAKSAAASAGVIYIECSALFFQSESERN